MAEMLIFMFGAFCLIGLAVGVAERSWGLGVFTVVAFTAVMSVLGGLFVLSRYLAEVLQ